MNSPKSITEHTVVCPVCGLVLPERLKKCPQDGVALKAALPPDPLVGTVVGGRYEILSVVGRGGMSVVYKARNSAVGSIVAIKTLKADLIADEELFARFCQEAKAVQMLIHPNIVSVHEFGVTLAGQPFIVMDYLAGQTLADAIEDLGRLPVKRSLKIFIQMCDALCHAHAQKMIHRDIKPGNIMLVQTATNDEFVKLFDFGFAKFLPQTGKYAQHITQTGDVLGTPLYMSPEQSKGLILDSRSDIYSIGCVMYETLTGKAPLVGENVLDTMQKQINERPESLDTARPDLYIPHQLTTVIFKTLEKEPSARYQSMTDLKRDLEKIYVALSAKVTTGAVNALELSKLKQAPQPGAQTRAVRPLITGLALGSLMVGSVAWILFRAGGAIHLEFGHKPSPQDAACSASPAQSASGERDLAWAQYRQAGLEAMKKKRFAEAEDLFNLSIQASEQSKSCPSHMAVNMVDLAQCYVRQGKLSDSEKACAKALNIRRKMHETNERPVADIFAVYAEIYLARENYKDAETYLQKALAIQQRELGASHEDVATTISALGRASVGQNNFGKAESYYKQALAIRTSALGPHDTLVAESLDDYAKLLRLMHRVKAAEKLESKAAVIHAEEREKNRT